MSQSPFLSIVMPVYNAQDYLEESVGSILSSSFQDFELLLVDDCSADRSKEICAAFAKKDPRVRFLPLAKNGGAGPARNAGMDAASGVYLTFADADDALDPAFYQKAVERLRMLPADLLIFGIIENYYDAAGRLVAKNHLCPQDAFLGTPQEVRAAVLPLEEKTLFGYQQNHLYRRALLEAHNIRFVHAPLHEDFFFNAQVIPRVQSMHLMAEEGYFYQKRPEGSLTARFVPDYFALTTKRVETLLALHREWGLLTPSARQVLGALYFRYILSALMRGSDPRAKLCRRARLRFVKALRQSALYREICQPTVPANAPLRLVKIAVEHAPPLALFLGRLVYFAKNHAVGYYRRQKQIKG